MMAGLSFVTLIVTVRLRLLLREQYPKGALLAEAPLHSK
jgi:hypothetical protein